MFDNDLRSADDGAVVAAIAQAAREEASAAARRLAAIAELARRRCCDDVRDRWSCDSWDAAAAEISAALGISQGRASGQLRLAVTLAQRLPRVAALFADGVLSYRVVAAIAWRTHLVDDDTALGCIDSAIAGHSRHWGRLSDVKLEQAIDMWINQYDPGALRRHQRAAGSRTVVIDNRDEESGTTGLWGRLFSTDAMILKRRLDQLARAVCDDDPRTMDQRRADALGAIAAGADALACRCGSPDCSAAAVASGVVIHVLAEGVSRTPDTDAPCPGGTSIVLGGSTIPGPMVADLISAGARVRKLCRPAAEPETRYRPSAMLERFVRIRDMTCRFPNCDKPGEYCDVDHAVAWPIGATHASNLRLLCRKHHLLKTFWTGAGGWSDEQSSDGTIRWTSPTGQVYTTLPGSRIFFPDWNTDTGDLPPGPRPSAPCPSRGLQMPLRARTRAAERASRIRRERALNDALVAERNKPPPF